MRKRRIWAVLFVSLVVLASNAFVPHAPKPEISLHAEGVPLLGLHIPNSMIATWLAMILLIGVSYAVTHKMALVPGRLQAAVEWAVEGLYNLSLRISGERTHMVFPVVATLFLFIVTANWMELLPGFGSVGIHTVEEGKRLFIPLLRSADTDLNTTVALAVFAVASIQLFGLRSLGPAYLKRFLNVKKVLGPGNLMERIATLFIGFLELFDQLTKVVSFSFRLFGNIFAGEVLLLVIAFLLPVIGPLPFMGLEIFVGFIQALIFALLTLVYAAEATGHGDEHPHAPPHEETAGDDASSNL
jgi:F-type H+-transporting ATPase subunit a